jgi:hypothetical protein
MSAEEDEDIKPAERGRGVGGKKWTGAEQEALLMTALQKGTSLSAFEGTITGRTANQCQTTWRITVLPRLRKFLSDDRPNNGGK